MQTLLTHGKQSFFVKPQRQNNMKNEIVWLLRS